ncbi:hypothetical protein T4B_7194 [Trichinella pseudospiralis]|uniref:Uncharacterized protein n=1 Tax=Trichinella pseudospiralis TaxID=6337 RepID=A0A0V1IT39_TRIPS|nr:hypothetical protein T4B_7194 [Trichinella pseudospiralis]
MAVKLHMVDHAISTKLPTKSLICITGKCKAVRYRGYACGCDRHHDYCSICCISCIGKDECQDLYNYSHCTQFYARKDSNYIIGFKMNSQHEIISI